MVKTTNQLRSGGAFLEDSMDLVVRKFATPGPLPTLHGMGNQQQKKQRMF
jgi:hypothetical protein